MYHIVREAIKGVPEDHRRNSPTAFSRGGKITPEFLITFLLATVTDSNRRGISHLLDEFWEAASKAGLDLPQASPVSASAITQARAKLPSTAMREVLWNLVNRMPDGCAARQSPTWRGRRVLAIDGQKLNTNRSDELKTTFGVPNGCHCPQLLFSVLVDCCARMPVDFEIDSYRVSEREHMSRMLDSVDDGAILVLDRGYPSHDVLQDLVERKIDFAIRVPRSNTFLAVEEFLASGRSEAWVTIARPAQAQSGGRKVRVRLVRFGRDEDETICVTTLRRSSFDAAAIQELYHLRWQAEESFKATSSNVLSQGLFRSASANGVRQELGAVVLHYAISRLLAGSASPHLADDRDQVQQKAAILAVSNILATVMLEGDEESGIQHVERSLERLLRHTYRPRARPSYPRRSYIPSPKWGPQGRRGA